MRLQTTPIIACTGRVLFGAMLLSLASCERRPTKEEMLVGMSDADLRAVQNMSSTPLVVDGINEPSFKAATEVDLADDQEVIGISFAGLQRAYPTKYMSGMLNHVVNDCIETPDGIACPVTITFCDITNCVRVVTSDTVGASVHLDVGTLGLVDGGLALRWNGHQFKQTDPIEGLDDVPFERTKWGEWKSKYPETEVLVGRSKKGNED